MVFHSAIVSFFFEASSLFIYNCAEYRYRLLGKRALEDEKKQKKLIKEWKGKNKKKYNWKIITAFGAKARTSHIFT